MLEVRSRNEKELVVILEAMEGCSVVKHWTNMPKPQAMPVIKEGTCSSCPHFVSKRNEYDRGGYVKWGTCNKLNANVNEHRECCSAYKNELREEAKGERNQERVVRRIHVA